MSSAREIAERWKDQREVDFTEEGLLWRGDHGSSEEAILARGFLAAEERIKELEIEKSMNAAYFRESDKQRTEASARIRALEECLREFTQAGVEYGAPRYLTIQIGREQMEAARTLLAAEKREDEGNG